MSNFLFPVLSENLVMDNSNGTAVPLNPDEIGNNNAFKESIKLNNIYINIQINRYKWLKELITQLMEDIEKELNI